VRRADAVSTTITERCVEDQAEAEALTGVKAMGAPVWRLLVVITALFLSLAWTGFLAWVVGRIVGVL
jgi:hypothetical protein